MVKYFGLGFTRDGQETGLSRAKLSQSGQCLELAPRVLSQLLLQRHPPTSWIKSVRGLPLEMMNRHMSLGLRLFKKTRLLAANAEARKQKLVSSRNRVLPRKGGIDIARLTEGCSTNFRWSTGFLVNTRIVPRISNIEQLIILLQCGRGRSPCPPCSQRWLR